MKRLMILAVCFSALVCVAQNNAVTKKKTLVINQETPESRAANVDRDVPVTETSQEKTFALIIANENYDQVADVDYALHDGRSFKNYCEKTLGIPANHILYSENATAGKIKSELKKSRDILEAYKGEASLIVYYAGHGVPDKNLDGYLLPTDCSGSDLSMAVALNDMYEEFSEVPAQSIVMFLDACFSGSKRGEGMIQNARAVKVVAKDNKPKGKVIVFSAAQGDETAHPYKEQRHGIFTYYLLKKLKDTKGEATLQELGEYVQTQVRQNSVNISETKHSQTPTMVASPKWGNDWKELKLK